MIRKKQFASTYYRRYNEPVPKEHTVHNFQAWRRAMIETKETIGYKEWLKGKLAETLSTAPGSTATQATP